MKKLLLAATAAFFSFAAAAQTGAPVVAGQTPADGRAYGEAVSATAQAKNDGGVKTPKLLKLDKPDKALADVQKDAHKARTQAQKDDYEAQKKARKDVRKAQRDANKDASKADKQAHKDAAKSMKVGGARAERAGRMERHARGEHQHGGYGIAHTKIHKVK